MEDTESTSSTAAATRPTLTRDPSSTTGQGQGQGGGQGGGNRPKGILKNSTPTVESAQQNEGVRWDEVNLNYNEVQKEATTRMQITEPKTPYVRYNAETDEVMDLDKIPGFELGQMDGQDQSQFASSSSSSSTAGASPGVVQQDDGTNAAAASAGGGDTDMQQQEHASAASDSGMHHQQQQQHQQQQHPIASSSSSGSAAGRPGAMRAPSASSRSSSFSGSRRGSESTSRRGSDVSERKMVVVEDHGPGVDAEDEGADEETRQAKKEFKMRRGSHYSGEGEMMKRFRAGQLELDDEDEEDGGDNDDNDNEDESAIEIDDAPAPTGQNGGDADANGQTARINGQGTTSQRTTRSGRRIPPVPPLPNGSS